MYFLNGYTKTRKPITIHIRGFNDEGSSGFINGEGIYIVERVSNPQEPKTICMHVVKQIGFVELKDGRPQFVYTDEEFMESINYKEQSGYSTLDGGNLFNSETSESYMYRSSTDPLGIPLHKLLASFGTFKPEKELRQNSDQNTSNNLSEKSRNCCSLF